MELFITGPVQLKKSTRPALWASAHSSAPPPSLTGEREWWTHNLIQPKNKGRRSASALPYKRKLFFHSFLLVSWMFVKNHIFTEKQSALLYQTLWQQITKWNLNCNAKSHIFFINKPCYFFRRRIPHKESKHWRSTRSAPMQWECISVIVTKLFVRVELPQKIRVISNLRFNVRPDERYRSCRWWIRSSGFRRSENGGTPASRLTFSYPHLLNGNYCFVGFAFLKGHYRWLICIWRVFRFCQVYWHFSCWCSGCCLVLD